MKMFQDKWGWVGAAILVALNLLGVVTMYQIIDVFATIYILGSIPFVLLGLIISALLGYGLGVAIHKIAK